MAQDYYEGYTDSHSDKPKTRWGQQTSQQFINDNKIARKGPWKAVFRIAIAVLLISLIALGIIAFSYLQGQQRYNRLEQNFNVSDGTLAGLSVDWDALRAINPDVVAWVYVPNTRINYPVVRGKDNEYYLTHDFDGNEGWLANFGAIFMDYRNAPNWQDDAYFIYGHHMNDGSMFADVANMRDQAKFDEARTIYLLSPQGNFKLRTMSLLHCSADDPLVQISFSSPEEKAAYIQDKLDRSIVQVDDAPAAANIMQTFAFSTCDNFEGGRYVLYSYVEEKSVADLVGSLGVEKDGDQPVGFQNTLSEQSNSSESSSQSS